VARLKLRNASPKVLAIARELAAFRERMAQERNIPRNRILKDDALMELVSTKPKSLSTCRNPACCCARRARARSPRGWWRRCSAGSTRRKRTGRACPRGGTARR
jgi:ribonuclease D